MASRYPPSHSLRRQSHRHVGQRSKELEQPQLPFARYHNDAQRLREAIATLDAQISALVLRRNQLEVHLERAVHSQSPVHRVPPEILAKIFELGVQQEEEDFSCLMVQTVMLVCRFWRDVALDTPTLWTKISVTPHETWKRVRLRLDRSKASPLHVSFSFDSRGNAVGDMMGNIIHAMDLIRPALWRVKTFQLNIPSKPQAHAILARCQEPAPMLEELSIEIEHSLQDDRGSSPILPLFKGHTPALRSCSFTSVQFRLGRRPRFEPPNPSTRWATSPGAPSPNTVLQILRNCPGLEELSLQNISAFDGGMFFPKDEVAQQVANKALSLPRLRKATFYYSGITLTTHIMNNALLPCLEILELHYLENIAPIMNRLYEQALTRLPLKKLKVVSCGFNELQFANVLRKLPSLTTLEFMACEDISSALLKALSTTQPLACPRLTTLVLDQCTNFSWDSLRTFVETRFFLSTKTLPSRNTNQTSSASTAAAAHAWSQAHSMPHSALPPPLRLQTIDVTQCTQIGKEMVQWLRMYTPNVVSQVSSSGSSSRSSWA
ncbi:hypothetical protein DL96DRAFT_177833 [Flagelloscypha sp. PMI_526]|nr:hypothetical protein DL96DRAFT_177833 [Flagelloscypha sp. PMI_526]